jgi:DNA repair protein RecO (recombination protein O)
LLLKLVAREDPHPGLFASYRLALDGLAAATADQATCLRRFELRLLSELGYGLSLTHEAATAQPVDPASRYHYVFERGPMPYSAGGDAARYPAVSGQTLLAMAGDDFDSSAVRSERKR